MDLITGQPVPAFQHGPAPTASDRKRFPGPSGGPRVKGGCRGVRDGVDTPNRYLSTCWMATADLQALGQFPLAHSLRPLCPDVLPLPLGQARPPARERPSARAFACPVQEAAAVVLGPAGFLGSNIAQGAAGADQPLHLQVQILVLRLSHRDPGVTVERHPAAPLAGIVRVYRPAREK